MSISIERAKMRAKTANLYGTLTAHTHWHTQTYARPGCGHVQGQAKRSRATVLQCGASQVESSSPRERVPFECDADCHFVPQPLSVANGAWSADRAYTWFLNTALSLALSFSLCDCDTVGCHNKLPLLLLLRAETWNRRPAIIKAA